jgi:pimeloyl-[acyl-carrier protein] methyl ester esterase
MKLLYLHGFATGPKIWEGQPEGETPAISFENCDQTAKAIGEGVGKGQRILIVGWSMGGMIALQLAAEYPEKVKALVLVSTTPKFIQSNDWQHGLPTAILRRLQKRIKIEGIRAFHSLIFDLSKENPGLADLSVEQAEKELAELEKIDLRGLLPEIKQPTLIIHGDQDHICLPGAGAYLHENIPQSKLVVFPGIKHVPFLEAPDLFRNTVKEFFDGFPVG